MNDLDTLLDIVPIPEGHVPASPLPQEEAAATIAASLLAADAPVAWLNGLADAMATPDPSERSAEFAELARRFDAEPQAWQAALEAAQRQQAQAYADLLPLGSYPESYPRHWLLEQYLACRARLLARFGEDAPGTARLAGFHAALAQRQQAWQGVHGLLAAITDGASLREQGEALQAFIGQALLAEARAQCEEGQLPSQVLATFEPSLRNASAAVLQVQWQGNTVPQAWVLVAEHAWAANLKSLPLLLWVQGEGGGLFYTQDLDELREKLAFTLAASLPTVFDHVVPRAGDDPAGLALAPLEGGLSAAIGGLIDHWAQQLESAQAGEAQERRLDETRAALAVPVDATRQLALSAVERQWQADAVAQHLPEWLLKRDREQRKAIALDLEAYHRAAASLEYWISEQIPEFPVFAGRLLAERIERDLNIKVLPQAQVVTRPVSVTFQWFSPGTVLEPPPQGAFLSPRQAEPGEAAQQWVASEEWETVTLAQLAMENLDATDEAEVQRLKMGQWHVPQLTAAYLTEALPDLDPLKQYEQRLREILDPALADNPERLRRPFEMELLLQATMSHYQRQLSDDGLRMMHAAARIHNPAILAAQGLHVHWLVINAKEELGHAIEGCCALVEGMDGRTVLCLPGAPGRYALLERETLDAAVAALRDAIRTDAAMADYVAHRLGGEPSQFLSYFRQAVERHYEGYLRAPRTSEQTLVTVQLHDRRAWLQGRAASQGRSQLDVLKARNLATQDRHLGYLRAALAVVPGVGTLVSLEDIYDSSRAAAAAWHQQDPDALGAAVLGVAGGVLDVLLSAIPVASSAVALRRAIRAHVKVRGSLQASRAALAGYEAQIRLRGATPLTGRDAGSWRVGTGQYIWQDGRAYAVYRRAGEDTLRLRATATRRYEAPVRRDGERWAIHADVGLRGGGGKLTDAEQIFGTWGPGSAHAPFTHATRKQAIERGRRLLAQYHLNTQQASEFAVAYLTDGNPPAWALRHRSGPGAAPTLPVPTQTWQQVRWTLRDADQIVSGSYGGQVSVRFFATGELHQGLRWQGEYYPLLPEAQGAGRVRYIPPTGRPPQNLEDLDELIRHGRGPRLVMLGQTRTDAPEILGVLSQRFIDRLARRFPEMSSESRQSWAQAIYHYADPEVNGLTQRRLQALEGLVTNPAQDPLLSLPARRIEGLEVPLLGRPSSGRLEQLRWTLSAEEGLELRNALGLGGGHSARVLVGRFIARQGYEMLLSHATPPRYLMVFRNPRTQRMYVLVQHTTGGTVSLQGSNGVPLLSAPWIDLLISRANNTQLAASMRTARAANQLEPLLGRLAIDGQRTELLWERIQMPTAAQGGALRVRSWRDATRGVEAGDLETAAGSGLYRTEAEPLAQWARVEDRLLPLFPAQDTARVMLSRPAGLPSPLTFEAIERCLRERFAEQPWLVVRSGQQWTVRRPLFLGMLDEQASRARPGMARQSALEVAQGIFERAQGSDHARLLHLEHVLTSWVGNSQALGELGDPLLMLARQQPTELQNAAGWQLALPAEASGARLEAHYLQAVEPQTRGLIAALGRPRMRHHAPNVIDDLLTRYGLVLEHRQGSFAQYTQATTGQRYLVALHVSEGAVAELALDGGLQVLSDTWIAQWLLRLDAAPAEALLQAMAQGRLQRLVTTLRLGGPLNGQVVIQRLADF